MKGLAAKTRIVAALALVAAALPSAAAPTGQISDIRAEKIGEGVEIQVVGKRLAKPKIIRAHEGVSFIAEFRANWPGMNVRRTIEHAGVEFAEFLWYTNRPPRIRVHLKLIEPSITPEVVERDNGWAIRVNLPPEAKPVSADPGLEANADPAPPKQDPDRLAFEQAARLLEMERQGRLISATPTSPPEVVVSLPGVAPTGAISQTATGAQLNQALVGMQPDLVTFDMIDTEVSLVLRAIAEQSGANIVVSPGLTGPGAAAGATGVPRITARLVSATVDEALAFVTALSNLKWAKVGNTYIVAEQTAFDGIMRQLTSRTGPTPNYDPADQFITRVVPTSSEDNQTIKAAVEAALPQFSERGYYAIQVPTSIDTSQVNAQQGSGGGTVTERTTNPTGTDDSSTTGTSQERSPTESRGESYTSRYIKNYLVVIGNASRVDEVVRYIEEVDAAIVKSKQTIQLVAAGAREALDTRIVPILSGNARTVETALNNLFQGYEWFRSGDGVQASVRVEQVGTPARNVLILTAPVSSIGEVASRAVELDRAILAATGAAGSDPSQALQFESVLIDLRYIEPSQAQAEVARQFPDITVRLLPNLVTPIPGPRPAIAGSSQAGAAATTAPQQESDLGPGDPNPELVPMKLMLSGPPSRLREAQAFLRLIDLAPKQVALELHVVEMTKEDAQQLGIDWNLLTGGIVKFLRLNNSAGGLESGDTSPNNRIGIGIDGDDINGDVSASFDALLSDNQVIARPNTLAVDGRPSRIFVGDRVRYIESIQSTQQGITVITAAIDVGVTLSVTPRTGADNTIIMDLAPSLTFLRRFDPVPGGGQLPQTSERTSQSTMVIKSGQTIAIGGLIQDQDVKTESGIPLLKDLPILGMLFKRSSTRKSRTEVVFFLTAKIIESPDSLPQRTPTEGGS